MMMAGNLGYSIKKANTELDYTPKTDLKAGITRTIKNYIENGFLSPRLNHH